MPCFSPVRGERAPGGRVTFTRKGFVDLPSVVVPCGRCVGCRLERSRQWAVRMMHEAQVNGPGAFVTLTFAPEHLPSDGSVCVRDWQLFAKRLRKRVGAFRYFACGEYGDELHRPHYHAALFGLAFSDRVYHGLVNGFRTYRSPVLESSWPFGFSSFGDLSFESAAYVARYCTKKVLGEASAEHYEGRKPEFATMSRRPGIGAAWWELYGESVRRADSVVSRGHEAAVPKFYEGLWERDDPKGFRAAKIRRRREPGPNDDWKRLQVREHLAKRKLRDSARSLERRK